LTQDDVYNPATLIVDTLAQDWQWVDVTSGDIGQAIASIEWAGNFVIGAGRAYCGQIACYGTSAIYWCNDVSSSASQSIYSLLKMGLTQLCVLEQLRY
jgi:hypothetical protein